MKVTTGVTMKDIARAAKVSRSTVSLCLANSPLIPEATRRRVRAAAAELGYRPNPQIQALMRARRLRHHPRHAPVLGFVSAFPTRDGLHAMRLMEQQFQGAQAAADRLGYHLKEFWLAEPKMTEKRFSQILHSRGIVGLLIAPMPAPRSLGGIRWERFCTVASGFSVGVPDLHRVAHDHYHAIVRAFSEAMALGYRRIGMAISARIQRRAENRWLAGFNLMQVAHPQLPGVAPFDAEEMTFEALKTWLRRTRPEVVIFETIPPELPGWLAALGLQVPRDLGVIGLNVYELGDAQTGICQVGREVGRSGIELLTALVERHDVGLPDHPTTLLVKGVWNPGSTVLKHARK